MKFRSFVTSSGNKVLCGKSAETNEELIKSHLGKSDVVLHTRAAGSPFCIIKENASKDDIKETAVFCASKSKDWRDNKHDVEVHYFKGSDVFKAPDMKLGTFGVKKAKSIIVKKNKILELAK
jgi:predicted ribosome quality control (RQC) complex YloA/Tae2 family protein